MQVVDSIFHIIVLIMSVVIHEYAHGYVAYMYGDDTARFAGRLTLNPIKHLELFGSFLLPLILIISNAGFILGWAKPVPYNPDNLKGGKKANIMVAIAGILANLGLAIIFGLLIRFAPVLFGMPAIDFYNLSSFYQITSSIVMLNIVLAFFNLIPIPPLDGSKVLFSLFPRKFYEIQTFLERWGIVLLIFFIVYVWKYVSPVIFWFFELLVGV